MPSERLTQNQHNTPEITPEAGDLDSPAIAERIHTQLTSSENKPSITERLQAPAEPLTDGQKNELLDLGASDKSEDVVAFVERKAQLTPAQAQEFDDYRENSRLLRMQYLTPQQFAAEITQLPEERRKAFYEFEKAKSDEAYAKEPAGTGMTPLHKEQLASAAQASDTVDLIKFSDAYQKLTPEQRDQLNAHRGLSQETEPKPVRIEETPDQPEGFAALYNLKFAEPEQFARQFKELSPTQKGKFDAFEAREDNKIRLDNPGVEIPRLSGDGETWLNTKPDDKPKSITEVATNEPDQTPEQMRAEGAKMYQEHRAVVDSMRASEPTVWGRVKKLFTRKRK